MRDRRCVLTGFIRLAVAIAVAFAGVGLAQAGDPGFATTRLRLRECPRVSSDCRVLMVLDRHAQIEILERSGDWLRVQTVSGGREGWVAARYVKEGDPPGAAGRRGSKDESPLAKHIPPWLRAGAKKVGVALLLVLIIIVLASAALGARSRTVYVPRPVRRPEPLPPFDPDPDPVPRAREWTWRRR